eukprot:NODE_9616_length_312_cov_93.577947_g7848_i0.p3 GENE.NODE_9616_length_312_cov_93.577947_g7848_i0~~NODE_9616_length_312_cov_93.577947_g7848_i0.p3  ORF type:complete len:61 (-),score=16.65 NODE_9616_length_312_cov_93.577947_g7848_i0:129-290(-)
MGQQAGHPTKFAKFSHTGHVYLPEKDSLVWKWLSGYTNKAMRSLEDLHRALQL